MIKRFALVLALALMPSAAMAQQHDHAREAVTAKTEHKNFVRELIAAKADLKLTATQVTKLEALAVKMDEMHAKMGEKHEAKADHAAHGGAKTDNHADVRHKMHTDLMAVFTEEQLVKIRPLMKAHHEKYEHMKAGVKH